MAGLKNKSGDDSGKRKDRQKGFLGAVLSASIGPSLKKWAEQAAMALPENHPLRQSEIFKRGFPALTTWLENISDELPIWAGALVEQLTDATDAFSAVMDVTTEQGESFSGPVVGYKWIEKLMSDIPERLKKAADKKGEFAAIKEELEFLQALSEEIENFSKLHQVAPKPKPAPTTFIEDIKKIDSAAETAACHVGKFANWLERKSNSGGGLASVINKMKGVK